MVRVSENSASASLQFALNKAKRKMEDLQMKGTSLKRITRPSDDPIGNVETLNISSNQSDIKQYKRNIDYALTQLYASDQSLEQLGDILLKAKEIAIAQASDFYGEGIRKNVANEVYQLRNQALSIANKRLGQRYIFGGYKSLEKPFTPDGKYHGDKGHVTVEISKDFFVPLNLHGAEVFFSTDDSSNKIEHPLKKFPELENKDKHDGENEKVNDVGMGRDLASITENEGGFAAYNNMFSQLEALATALENDDAPLIQGLLEKFDDTADRLVGLRTRIGSLINSADSAENIHGADNVNLATRKSKVQDADIAELFADITKQQGILKTTYQTAKGTINQNLMDFLR
jgi:flagellar hook-associated protein 3 FlgL